MESVILVIHLILALAIIGLVLIQRSEGGGLGIGSGGGMGSFASAQTTANALSRMTAICAGLFFVTSLVLGIMAGGHQSKLGIAESLEKQSAATTSTAAPAPEEEKPAPPQQPKAPVSE